MPPSSLDIMHLLSNSLTLFPILSPCITHNTELRHQPKSNRQANSVRVLLPPPGHALASTSKTKDLLASILTNGPPHHPSPRLVGPGLY